MYDDKMIINVKGLNTVISGKKLHDHIDFEVEKGSIHAIVGGSGTGKSVLLKVILGLMPYESGQISILGINPHHMSDQEAEIFRSRTGVMFQDGALFTSLTVYENLMVPVKRWGKYDQSFMDEIIMLKLKQVGLSDDVAIKYPAELSGGMRKRVSLARALILDPEIIFLDEPTAGLDPIGAHHFDLLVRELNSTLGVTTIMVTHDLDSLKLVCDKISLLLDQKIMTNSYKGFKGLNHPKWIYDYFNGPRAK